MCVCVCVCVCAHKGALFLSLQTLEESMEKIDEDAHVLINSDLASDEEGKRMHSAMQQAIDSVKTQVEELRKSYKELTDLCQQKRDTFVLCVKFHMMTRQVGRYPLTTMHGETEPPMYNN